MSKVLSIEEIDKKIEKSYVPKGELSAKKEIAGEKATFNLCNVWNTGGRDIFVFAKTLLFFKPKWQQIIDAIIAGLDSQCKVK